MTVGVVQHRGRAWNTGRSLVKHHLLEGSKGVGRGAVFRMGSLLGGSECFGGKFDVGDGWVGVLPLRWRLREMLCGV